LGISSIAKLGIQSSGLHVDELGVFGGIEAWEKGKDNSGVAPSNVDPLILHCPCIYNHGSIYFSSKPSSRRVFNS